MYTLSKTTVIFSLCIFSAHFIFSCENPFLDTCFKLKDKSGCNLIEKVEIKFKKGNKHSL
jgi:hypothetical protein